MIKRKPLKSWEKTIQSGPVGPETDQNEDPGRGTNGPAGPLHGDPIFGQPENSGDVWRGGSINVAGQPFKFKVIPMDDLLDYLDLGVDPFDAIKALSEDDFVPSPSADFMYGPPMEGEIADDDFLDEDVLDEVAAVLDKLPPEDPEPTIKDERAYNLFVADRIEDAIPLFDNEHDVALGWEIVDQLRAGGNRETLLEEAMIGGREPTDEEIKLAEKIGYEFSFPDDPPSPICKPAEPIEFSLTGQTNQVDYKFREGETLDEIRRYIDETYSGPYAGKRGIQAFDLIDSANHGLGFCMGNAIKYAARYGKKDGHNKKDIMKAIHYLIMALYVVKDEGIE